MEATLDRSLYIGIVVRAVQSCSTRIRKRDRAQIRRRDSASLDIMRRHRLRIAVAVHIHDENARGQRVLRRSNPDRGEDKSERDEKAHSFMMRRNHELRGEEGLGTGWPLP